MNRAIVVLCAVLALAALLPADATAHAIFVSSTPAPDSIFPYNATPRSVSITLSEAVESGAGGIRVTNGTGCSGSLGPGTSSGAPVSPFEVGLRFIAFFGLAAALGASVLGAFMWIPAGRDPDVKETPAYRLGFQIVTNVARIGAFGFALAYAGLFLLTDALDSTSSGGSVIGSPYKLSVVLSVAVGAVLFVILSRAFVLARKESPDSTERYLLISALLGFAAMGSGARAPMPPPCSRLAGSPVTSGSIPWPR